MSRLHRLSAVAATLVAGALGAGVVQAAGNPFTANDLPGGYRQLAAAEGACGEGRCGEGKCGGAQPAEKTAEGKCGEGKCGEGMCGNRMQDAGTPAADGKARAATPAPAEAGKTQEGKCGEGVCGAAHGAN